MGGMGGPSGPGNSLIIQAFHSALLRQAGLIFVVAVVIGLAWNGLRTLQYRRAVAAGRPFPPPRPEIGPEPVARRVLRIGFGVVWVIDGLLQLQQNMPADLPSQVLQPAASGSPRWVGDLVNFGADAWTRHPVTAGASAVWIQLGIGVFLLVAPRGRWSRVAGLTSAGWGLVVWVFGEALGGILAPGQTVLFGLPGAALVYAVAGGLIALPERAWVGQRLGRLITAVAGAFLLGMAVLQAWPGRGFWQGGTTAHPGSLGSMVSQMATTPQPHLLASAVSGFASFDIAHGWGVNLFVVVALTLTGLALLSGRRQLLGPTVVVLVVLGLADWVLIEDLGWFGGVGTDPNSMVPLLLLVVSGYLAVVRAPVTVDEPVPAAAAPVRRSWERIDSGYTGRLALSLAAVFVVMVGAAPMASASISRSSDTVLADSVDGPPAPLSGPAPGFQLEDQNGRPVSLTSLRGYTVALTFLDPVCTSDCPVIAQEFRLASQLLGASASKVRFVAVAANPIYYSTSVIRAFDRQEDLENQSNWLFLTGSLSELTSVWNQYGITVVSAPAGAMAVHSETTYLIDAHGNDRVALNTDPGSGSADDRSFSEVLASQITQVMHR